MPTPLSVTSRQLEPIHSKGCHAPPPPSPATLRVVRLVLDDDVGAERGNAPHVGHGDVRAGLSRRWRVAVVVAELEGRKAGGEADLRLRMRDVERLQVGAPVW